MITIYHVYAFSAISDEEISEVIKRLPPVQLSSEMTRNLLHNLAPPSKMVSYQMNLKEVLQHCHRYKVSLSLEDIVEALMLTQGLGRYVTSLMPFRMFSNINSLHNYIIYLKSSINCVSCVCMCVCLFVVFCHHEHLDPEI